MITKANCWVVTDIDGTLMDHNYDFTPALETLFWLRELGIPVIPCTSKTASEVRHLRKQLDSEDPFIVENGGAIYGNNKSSSEEWELILGKSFEELRPLLNILSNKLDYKLIALNDLSHNEITDLTGLKGDSIDMALKREWSVPFLNPPELLRKDLLRYSEEINTTIYQGNRMSHLLGQGSHKGKAVIELKKFFNTPNVTIIALGDSQNDLPLLDVADIPIVIPGKNGPNKFLIEGIKKNKFTLAPAAHAKGWAMAVKNAINNL